MPNYIATLEGFHGDEVTTDGLANPGYGSGKLAAGQFMPARGPAVPQEVLLVQRAALVAQAQALKLDPSPSTPGRLRAIAVQTRNVSRRIAHRRVVQTRRRHANTGMRGVTLEGLGATGSGSVFSTALRNLKAKQASLIPGVPNMYLYIGGAAVAGYFLFLRKR